MPKSWKTLTHDSKDPRYNALKDAMNDISRRKNKGTLNLWTHVSAALKQAQLDKDHSAASVLEYSYLQGLIYLEQGNTIDRPMAWMRLMSFRYIRTLRKDALAKR